MTKARKQAASEAPSLPQVGDKVYTPRLEMVYEISEVCVGGDEADLHVSDTNLEQCASGLLLELLDKHWQLG
jgi:hypothetical protein